MPSVTERVTAAVADRYAVERELSSGGMATVYVAQDRKHGRKVAIKVLKPELAAAIGTDRFVREIEIAANLTHPHILPLFDSGEADGFLYYVMPFVDGESLRDRLERETRLPVDEAIRLTDQIASALAHAHERGVVHRDIKPENILLAGDQAIVADFGIARAVAAAGGDRLTGTGLAIGTPAYMSPEQAFGTDEVDGRTDVYSLGCVVYEMVSGRAPFEGPTPQALLARHAADTVPRLRAGNPTVPLFVERAVERALAKDPAERFATARAFAEALTTGFVVARVRGTRRGKRRWIVAASSAAAAAVLITLGTGLWDRFQPRAAALTPIRLAVLPFENLTGDLEQEYLSDALADEIRTELSRLHPERLSVIARASSIRYKDRTTPLDEIGRELGVDYLLEGAFRREGTRMRINATLIHVPDQTQRWAESYDRERDGMLALQSDVARGVAGSLALALLPAEEARFTAARPVNPEAYESYLRGVTYLERATPSDLETALRYFEFALRHDPNYARAHLGIGQVWSARQQGALVAPSEAGPKLRAAVDLALELDPMLAEAHFARATQLTWTDWDWAPAEASFRRAIDLNPNYARARAFYSQYLHIMRRPEEAMVQAQRALELDPVNPDVRATVGGALLMARRYDEALEHFHAVGRMEPNSLRSLIGIANALAYAERHEEALAAERALAMVGRGDPELDQALAMGYEEDGYRGAMRHAAETLAARPVQSRVGFSRVARLYLRAGEGERALDWLERAYEAGDPSIPFIASGHKDFDLVRGHPRFEALLERLNLPRSGEVRTSPF